jgi:hypothetical protein
LTGSIAFAAIYFSTVLYPEPDLSDVFCEDGPAREACDQRFLQSRERLTAWRRVTQLGYAALGLGLIVSAGLLSQRSSWVSLGLLGGGLFLVGAAMRFAWVAFGKST